MRSESRNGGLSFALHPRGPLDVDATLRRYRLWGVDPANVWADGAFYRVAAVGPARVPFRLTARGGPEQPRLAVTFWGPDTATVRSGLRREVTSLLGLGADLAGFRAHAARDPVLAPLVRPGSGLWGLRPTLTPDPLEMLVGAISAQQITLRFAFETRARLVRRFGVPHEVDGVTVYAFPPAATLAGVDPAELRRLQFSTRKAEYIVGLARAVAAGDLDFDRLVAAPDDEVIARLTALRGLGRWTAEWFLVRGLGRPDVCPAGDLGVRRAVEALCFRGRRADAARVRRRAAAWRPYRSLAVHYLLAAHRWLGAGSGEAQPDGPPSRATWGSHDVVGGAGGGAAGVLPPRLVGGTARPALAAAGGEA